MLPAITLILFFQGAMIAGHAVINAKNAKSRKMAMLLALILGIIPSWQTISVWDQAGGFDLYKKATIRWRLTKNFLNSCIYVCYV